MIWKDIKNWEPYYEINDLGQVRNKLTNHIKLIDTNSAGYKRVTLYNKSHNPNSERFFVHRLVAMTFIPNPNNLPEVNHKDENKANNSVSNLEWVSRRENERYSMLNGSKRNKYKPFIVEFLSGQQRKYDTKKDLAFEVGVTTVLVKYWLHKKSATYTSYGIKSIYYI